jgi:predicted ATP-grasp superfamily ATP-dependent carboligase
MRVLILDEVHDRPSLAAARALVMAGWTVGIAGAERSLAARSKASAAWHPIVPPGHGNEAFVESVEQVVRSHGYETVLPGYEPALVALSAQRERLSFPLGYGAHDGILAAIDKWRLVSLAQAAGLEVPRTVPASADRLAELDDPVVIKSGSPCDVRLAAAVFTDRTAALAHADAIVARGGNPIAQELLDGRLDAVSLVAGPDGIVSIAQQVADQSWPQPVGVTARGRTVPVDPALRAAIERLLDALGWQGLAQLQFLVAADGRPRLIDFNPRFYGSLALAVKAGANHPDTWARLATGRPVTPSEGRPGARYQWFSRDLRASLAASDSVRETVRCLAICPIAAHTLLSWRDPVLAPTFLLEQARRAASGRVRRRPGDAVASARLHGVEPSRAVLHALRTRRVPPWPERLHQRIAMKRGRLTYEEQWLAPLQDARSDALGPTADGAPRFLVRVDEFPYYSGYDDPRFGYDASSRFHSIMAEAGVHYLIAVVPQWTHAPLNPEAAGGRALDDRDREFLERMHAEGVSFAQHGTTHRTRFSSPRRRSELGGLDSRALGALLDDGRRRLEATGIRSRVLVPPFNTFEAAQWPVLASRYDVITGGPESVLRMGFHGGPQWREGAVYLPCYAPLYERASVVLGAVERLTDQRIGTWVPVVLHLGWEVADDFAALARLAQRIAPFAASWDDFLSAVDASREG